MSCRQSGKTGEPCLRAWRMFDEELAHAANDGIGQLVLIGIVVKTAFFVRIRDEGGFNQRRRNIRRLEDRKAGLLDAGLVQGIDRTEFPEQVLAEFQAVADRRRLRQVEQRARQEQILGA